MALPRKLFIGEEGLVRSIFNIGDGDIHTFTRGNLCRKHAISETSFYNWKAK